MFPKFEKESKQFIVCFVFQKKKKKIQHFPVMLN